MTFVQTLFLLAKLFVTNKISITNPKTHRIETFPRADKYFVLLNNRFSLFFDSSQKRPPKRGTNSIHTRALRTLLYKSFGFIFTPRC